MTAASASGIRPDALNPAPGVSDRRDRSAPEPELDLLGSEATHERLQRQQRGQAALVQLALTAGQPQKP